MDSTPSAKERAARKQTRRPCDGAPPKVRRRDTPLTPPPPSVAAGASKQRRCGHALQVLHRAASAAAQRVAEALFTVLSLVAQLLAETVLAPVVWLFSKIYQFPADVQFKRTTERYLSVLSSTESYKTYFPTAKLLDAHLGIDEWRLHAPKRSICNAEALVFDAQVALALAGSGNPVAMGNFLRGMLVRNAHGMTNPELYPYYTGTKACIEDYCAAVCALIAIFGGSKSSHVTNTLRVQPCYEERRHADGTRVVVDLTSIAGMQAIPKPTVAPHRAVSAPDKTGLVDSRKHSNTRVSLPSNPQSFQSVGRSSGGGRTERSHRGESAQLAKPLNLCSSQKRAGTVSGGDPNCALSDEDNVAEASVSPPSSHDALPNSAHTSSGLASGAAQSFSHLTVSATSSDELRSSHGRRGGTISVTASATTTTTNVPERDSDAFASPPPESRFLQTMASWARTHATAPTSKPKSAELPAEDAVMVPVEMSPQQRLTVLRDVLRSYGRTALILSGGASMGTYHTGVVRALYEAGALPDIISGSSAGSIIACIVCTKSPKTLKSFIEVDVLSTEVLQMSPFGNETSLLQKLRRLLKTGFLMDVRSLMECVRAQCGDMTFQEAFEISGRVLNITVTRYNQKGTHFDRHVLLNYLTAPNVVIWSAVSASSALPGLFTAVQLIEKSPETGFFQMYLPGELYCDGSVAQDIPRSRLAQLFNVNYLIVSQVNPYVIPFLHPPSTVTSEAKRRAPARTTAVGLSAKHHMPLLGWLWYGGAAFVCQMMLKCFDSGVVPKTGKFEMPYLLLTQTYCGHVTLLPIGNFTSALPDYLNMTSNPTAEYISYVATRAQVRTWPVVARIKHATCIERALLKEIALLEKTTRKGDR